MALLYLMRFSLRVISSITEFLLNEDTPTCPIPHDTLVASHTSDEHSTIIDYTLSYLARHFDFSLPRTLTVFNELSPSTAFLIRLTEVIPSNIILVLVAWGLFSIVCVTSLSVCAGGYGVFLMFQYTRRAVHEHRVTPIIVEVEEDEAFSTHDSTSSLPTSPQSLALSDTARALVPSVNANSSGMLVRPQRLRHPRTRPSM